jgi:hypothetical protein
MTIRHRDADLAVLLHPANAGAVAGARIDHNEGPFGWIDRLSIERLDPDQQVIDWPFELSAIQNQLGVEVEDVRRLLGLLPPEDIAALPQNIEEQDRPLPRVLEIFVSGSEILLISHAKAPGEEAANISREPNRPIGISPDAMHNFFSPLALSAIS